MDRKNHADSVGKSKVNMIVSVYGDGALLDASLGNNVSDLRTDEEGETAIIRLFDVPTLVAIAAIDYCRHDNSGPNPYSDAYEAMECIQQAKRSEVYDCSVPWSPAECKRLGGCYLCGGSHDEN